MMKIMTIIMITIIMITMRSVLVMTRTIIMITTIMITTREECSDEDYDKYYDYYHHDQIHIEDENSKRFHP